MSRSPLIAAVVAAAAGIAYALASWAGTGEATLRHAWDLLFPDGRVDPGVVVVAIDDRAIEEVGEWPWSRADQARLIDGIAGAGAASVGYDVLMPDGATGDAALAASMRNVPVVLAEAFSSTTLTDRSLFTVSGTVPPSPELAAAAAAPGSVAAPADSDGVVRTVPAVVETEDGQLVGALALRAVDLVDGVADQIYVRPRAVQVDDLVVPTEPGALMRVHWADGFGRGDPQVISAADVLSGAADLGALEGAVVMVGATAVALGDRHVTPLSPGLSTPGVLVQAAAASTMLSERWVMPVPWWMSLLIVLALGFGAAWAAIGWKLRWVAAGTVLAAAVYLLLAVAAFGTTGWLADLFRVPLAMVGCVTVAVAAHLLIEQRARRQTVELFRRYVPERVAVELLRSGRHVDAAAGQRATVGLTFCDLRGFTPLAAHLEPAEVRRILDDYYDYACRAIFAKGGTVMQFVGDEVFAVFGAPEPLTDPAAAARDVGIALQAGASELTRALEADGLPPVRFGVGVHVGEVVAAHVGPDHRRQYAVIGDAVNVASRLCGIAEAGDVVVSVAAAGDLRGSMREVELKGVDHPVAVLTLHPGSEAEAASPGVRTQSFDAVDGDGAAARRDDHHVVELPEDLVDGRS